MHHGMFSCSAHQRTVSRSFTFMPNKLHILGKVLLQDVWFSYAEYTTRNAPLSKVNRKRYSTVRGKVEQTAYWDGINEDLKNEAVSIIFNTIMTLYVSFE